jgi:hypothetical protein
VAAKGRLPVPVGPTAAGARNLQRRIDAVPEWIRPAFGEFRDYVRDQAKAYEEAIPRPNRQGLRDYIVGFLGAISAPLELAQAGAIAAGYYLPLPERLNRVTAGAPSALSTLAGETIVWGSAFTATAGGLTIATVAEMLDVYAIASLRTTRYRWAQLSPGPAVLRSDVVHILDGPGQGFSRGAVGHLVLEGLGELASLAARGIVSELATPVVGAVRGGLRTRSALRLAQTEPLTPVPPSEVPRRANLSGPPPASFYDWFRRAGPSTLPVSDPSR